MWWNCCRKGVFKRFVTTIDLKEGMSVYMEMNIDRWIYIHCPITFVFDWIE